MCCRDHWPLTFLIVLTNNYDLVWNDGAKWSKGNEWSTANEWNKQGSQMEWQPSRVRGLSEPQGVMSFICDANYNTAFTLNICHTLCSKISVIWCHYSWNEENWRRWRIFGFLGQNIRAKMNHYNTVKACLSLLYLLLLKWPYELLPGDSLLSLKSIAELLRRKRNSVFVVDWLHRGLCREDRKNRRKKGSLLTYLPYHTAILWLIVYWIISCLTLQIWVSWQKLESQEFVMIRVHLNRYLFLT